MITKLSIQNFKGVADRVDIELRPITLLFGANSAGKSTLIHALNYARELLQRRNLDADQTIMGGETSPLGGFHSFVHNHDINRTVTIGVHVSNTSGNLPSFSDQIYKSFINRKPVDESDAVSLVSPESVGVEFDIRWSSINQEPCITRFETFADGEFIARIEHEPGRRNQDLVINLDNPAFLNESSLQLVPISQVVNENGELSTTEKEFSDVDFAVFPLLVKNLMHCGMLPGANLHTENPHAHGLIRIPIISEEDAYPRLDSMFGGLNGYRIDYSSLIEDSNVEDRVYTGIHPRTDLSVAGSTIGDEPHIWEFNYRAVLSEILCGIGQVVRKELERAYYIGPIRQAPDRSYVPLQIETAHRWSTGLAAWDFLYTSDVTPFIGEISDWLSESDRLDTGYRIQQKTYFQLDAYSKLGFKLQSGRITEIEEGDYDARELKPITQVAIIPANTEGPALKPQDVGEGITQVLPIVVACLMGHTGLLSIEQPELHVHPRLQTSLGDLFIETLGEQDNNFLIETHSEHLILRLLKRIRQTFDEHDPPPEDRQLEPRHLAIYHVRQSDGQTTISNIEVDTSGEFIQPWPDDFFELDFKERYS